MKRKYLAIIYLLLLSMGTILSLYMPKNETKANDAVVIPSDAIRLRILANSDSEEDQELKRLVRDEVNEEITKWVAQLTSKEEARNVIKAGLPEIEEIAEQVMAEQNADQEVKVEFGEVEFPTKLYGEFLYPAGTYEAILITLGDGVGANWWCVLFPPLCFLDFSNGVAVSEGFDEEGAVAKAEAEEIAQEENEETVAIEEVEKEEPANEAAVKSEVTSVKPAEKTTEEKAAAMSAEETTEEEEKPEVKEEQKDKREKTEPVEMKKGAAEKTETTEIKKDETETKQEPVFAAEKDEVEVKFFIKEVWDKIFG